MPPSLGMVVSMEEEIVLVSDVLTWATDATDTFTKEYVANAAQSLEFYDQAHGPHSDVPFKGIPVTRLCPECGRVAFEKESHV